jgi:ribosomal protein S18 acetylase RimI-like enzyme
MRVSVRDAEAADLEAVECLYRGLEGEMTDLHPMWPRADGLSEPVGEALAAALADPDCYLLVGSIDEVAVGFLLARVEDLLPQAGGERVGVIRYIYTEPAAREVGVGELMRETAMSRLRTLGISAFDAYVLPGHRLAKNFFEAGGFSARAIIMHHDDHPRERPGRDPRRF